MSVLSEQERYQQALHSISLDRLVGCSYAPIWISAARSNWAYCNPSIARNPDGGFVSLVRYSSWPRITVNYPYHSELVLARLDGDCNVVSAKQLSEPARAIDSSFNQTFGPEDARLFQIGARWFATATFFDVPECRIDGQVLARMGLLEFDSDFNWTKMTVLPCPFKQHEKNWMQIDGEMAWLYSPHDTRIVRYDHDTHALQYYRPQQTPDIMRHARGSSQLIDIGDNQLLGVIHESAHAVPSRTYIGRYRAYSHRFVLYSRAPFALRAISPLFHFFAPAQTEFAAGLAVADGRAVVSFGHHDSWAWLANMALADVLRVLDPV